MDVGRARSALAATRFGDVEWVAETGSTNADLAMRARVDPADRVLVADHQTAGRGRLDRRWEARSGASLLMSIAVVEPFPASGAWLVQTALGVAAHDALAALGVPVGLKWPNDLVAVGVGEAGADLKLGGMLAELVAPHGLASTVVAGIGINVDWHDGFPPELASIATSVDLLGVHVDRLDLLVDVVRRFDALYRPTLDTAGASDLLLAEYADACVTVGREVRVVLPSGGVEGTAIEIGANGVLVVRDAAGDHHAVTAGDVVHLRPA